MCDTFVWPAKTSPDGATWFGKNSDREPDEEQLVERSPMRVANQKGATLACTALTIDELERTHATLLSRPAWMWGAEMGANEHNVVIGNEAVFTKFPVPDTGLLGMDLLRLALERATTADEATQVITGLVSRYGQGGRAGFRDAGMRYHSSFLVADPVEVWVLETAGPFWAARRVTTPTSISNALTIGRDFDRLSDGALAWAKERRLATSARDFDFARVFGRAAYRVLSGADARRACTRSELQSSPDSLRDAAMRALRSHAGRHPASGWRMEMPCAHASLWPTRHAGQTTASMVSRLTARGSRHWMTATSSPCLSVFKPIAVTPPKEHAKAPPRDSLFWEHEKLHRAVLESYDDRRATFEADRAAFEARALLASPSEWDSLVLEQIELSRAFLARAAAAPPSREHLAFRAYWWWRNQRAAHV